MNKLCCPNKAVLALRPVCQSDSGAKISTSTKRSVLYPHFSISEIKSHLLHHIQLNNANKYPNTAPLRTIKAEFIFLMQKNAIVLNAAINSVLQSIRTCTPSLIPTTSITAKALMLTASKKAEKIFELLNRGTIGLTIRTKINEGRKIPSVANKAPCAPAI